MLCKQGQDTCTTVSGCWLCDRCLEGLFDTWGTFGVGFNGDLEMGGPTPIGAQRANLSDTVRMYMEEVALNEQV